MSEAVRDEQRVLLYAVLKNRRDQVGRLLPKCSNVNAPCFVEELGKAYTPLMLAAELGHAEVMEILLDGGAVDRFAEADWAEGEGDSHSKDRLARPSCVLVRALLKNRENTALQIVARIESASIAAKYLNCLTDLKLRHGDSSVTTLLESVLLQLLAKFDSLRTRSDREEQPDSSLVDVRGLIDVCCMYGFDFLLLRILRTCGNGLIRRGDLIWRMIPMRCSIANRRGDGQAACHAVLRLMVESADEGMITALFELHAQMKLCLLSRSVVECIIAHAPGFLSERARYPLHQIFNLGTVPLEWRGHDSFAIGLLEQLELWLAAGISVPNLAPSPHLAEMTALAIVADSLLKYSTLHAATSVRKAIITAAIQLRLVGCSLQVSTELGNKVFFGLEEHAPQFAHALIAMPSLQTLCVNAVRSSLHRPITATCASRLPLPPSHQALIAGGFLKIDPNVVDAMARDCRPQSARRQQEAAFRRRMLQMALDNFAADLEF